MASLVWKGLLSSHRWHCLLPYLPAPNQPQNQPKKAKIVHQGSQHIKAITAVLSDMHTLQTALLQQHITVTQFWKYEQIAWRQIKQFGEYSNSSSHNQLCKMVQKSPLRLMIYRIWPLLKKGAALNILTLECRIPSCVFWTNKSVTDNACDRGSKKTPSFWCLNFLGLFNLNKVQAVLV
jgi:hypothetical protein